MPARIECVASNEKRKINHRGTETQRY